MMAMGAQDRTMAMQDMEVGEQRQEEAPSTFQRIEELESHGINKQDIQKLKAAGYHTIESVSLSLCLSLPLSLGSTRLSPCLPQVAHSTLRKLTDVKGISEQKAQKLKELIKQNQLVSTGFTSVGPSFDSPLPHPPRPPPARRQRGSR
jgi:ERCC4-type nuclease